MLHETIPEQKNEHYGNVIILLTIQLFLCFKITSFYDPTIITNLPLDQMQ